MTTGIGVPQPQREFQTVAAHQGWYAQPCFALDVASWLALCCGTQVQVPGVISGPTRVSPGHVHSLSPSTVCIQIVRVPAMARPQMGPWISEWEI